MSANHTVNSITTRGAIDVTALVCVPCKKKHGGAGTCYAHTMSSDGKPICIFCEDGEACIFEQRQAKAAKKSQISGVKKTLTPTPVPATSSKVPAPPQQSPVVNPGSPWRKFGSLTLQPKEKPMETAAVRPNGHAPSAASRLCKCECGGIVPAENRFAYIKGHMSRGGKKKTAVAQKKRGRPSSAPKVASRETLVPTIAARASESQFTLQVTEAQLDRFLGKVDWNPVIAKLPAELKLQLANHYFAACLDQVEAKAEAAA